MAKKLCIICRSNPATVPDRYAGIGRMTNKLCTSCHGRRLADDLKVVLSHYKRRAPTEGQE